MIKQHLKENKFIWRLYCLLYFKIIGRNKVKINGKQNEIRVKNAILKNARVKINGNGNRIFINFQVRFSGEIVIHGDNNVLIIEDDCTIKNTRFWLEDNGNEINIKKNTSIESGSALSAIEGTKIEVGEECMISSEVFIRTGDSHSILDLKGNRINPSKNIFIGNHVWLGHRSTVSKGAKISGDSIVASCAMVTKQFNQSNCVLSGTPATILKENINWDKNRIFIIKDERKYIVCKKFI